MENTDAKIIKNSPSFVEKLGKFGVQIGDKLGKVATEFFMGKQPTKEEKELNVIRKERKLKLKLIQEDAEYERDLVLAEKGQYVPPAPIVKDVKKTKNISGMFDNLGKYNPIAEFEKNKSLGTTNFSIGGNQANKSKTPDFGLGGIGTGRTEPDFGLDGFVGTKNPIKKSKI